MIPILTAVALTAVAHLVIRVRTCPGNPGISWKMKSILECGFGFMSLNILEKSALLETKEKDGTLSQYLSVMDLTFATVSETHAHIQKNTEGKILVLYM